MIMIIIFMNDYLVQLVLMTPVPSPMIDMLGPFHRSVQPGLFMCFISDFGQKYIHGFSPGSENNTGSHNGHREKASNVKQGCLAESLIRKLIMMMIEMMRKKAKKEPDLLVHLIIIVVITFV